MSDQSNTGASEYQHHDATPGSAPDRSADTAVQDSFPASDPVATTAAVGSRAVDPSHMMSGQTPRPEGHRTLRIRFADRESAKLATERLVRDVPLAQHAVTAGEDDSTLEIVVAAPNISRVCRIVRQCSGEVGFADQVAELGEMVDGLVRNVALPAAAQAARAGKRMAKSTGTAAAAGASRAAAAVRERPFTTVGLLSAAALLALAVQAGTHGRFSGHHWGARSRRW